MVSEKYISCNFAVVFSLQKFQFLGNWYILEYEYAEETRLNSVDCLGFKFTVDDVPSLQLVHKYLKRKLQFHFKK